MPRSAPTSRCISSASAATGPSGEARELNRLMTDWLVRRSGVLQEGRCASAASTLVRIPVTGSTRARRVGPRALPQRARLRRDPSRAGRGPAGRRRPRWTLKRERWTRGPRGGSTRSSTWPARTSRAAAGPAAKKARIRGSRVEGTALLARTLASADRPRGACLRLPIGYSKTGATRRLTEESAPGSGFLASVCREWEAAADARAEAGVRVLHLRSASA